jgi:hypothetical protein
MRRTQRLESRRAEQRTPRDRRLSRALPAGVDRRTRPAKRYAALYEKYRALAGDGHDELARQAAGLVLRREQLEARMIAGEEVDALLLARLAGAINRTLAKMKLANVDPDSTRQQREREDREAGLIP